MDLSQTSKNWIYGIGATVVAAAGYVGYNVAKKPATERAASTTTSTIDISTTGAKPLTFQLGTATVDIQYTAAPNRVKEKDLLDPAWISQMKNLGFSFAWAFSDGSITNYAYPNTGGRGKGYNGKSSDFKTQADYEAWGNGVLIQSWPSDWFLKTFDFCAAWGVPCNVSLNKKNTWAQNKWLIDHATGNYILLSSETVSDKGAGEAWGWQQYLDWAKVTRDSILKVYGTTKNIIVDQALLYRGSRQNEDWRKNITPTTLTGCWGADVYWQIGDQLRTVAKTPYSANQDSNIIRTNKFFDSIVPAQISQFQTLWPGWKMFAGECLIEDADANDDIPVYVNKAITGVYTIGRFALSFIQNQDIQPLAVQMSLKSVDQVADNNTKAWALVNKMFKPGYNVATLTLSNMDSCIGAVLQNQATTTIYSILIANSGKRAYTVSTLNVNGKPKTPTTYTLQRLYSSDGSWYGSVSQDSISSATIIIPAASINVITFNTKAKTTPAQIK